MRNSKLSKKPKSSRTRPKRDTMQLVDMKRLPQFCDLWSLGNSVNEIGKIMKISRGQAYKYLDAAEEMADEFIMGFVDHGLVLQHADALRKMKTILNKTFKAAEKAATELEEMDMKGNLNKAGQLKNIVNAYLQSQKQHSEMLNDSKLTNQAMKTINKVIVKNAQDREKPGRAN